MNPTESLLSRELPGIIQGERERIVALTQSGNEAMFVHTTLGILATSLAVVVNRPGILALTTAASVFSIVGGARGWLLARRVQEEVGAIETFEKVLDRAYTDYHGKQNFVRTIH